MKRYGKLKKMTQLDPKDSTFKIFNQLCFDLFHHYGAHCTSFEPSTLIHAKPMQQLPEQASFDIFSLDFGHWCAKLSYAGMYLKIDAGWEFQLEFKDQHGQIFQKSL
ncbi:hypothetical protein B1202_15070 [Acinetobacter amyesii]|uniref:Uncharacterized protein n=2 Tax=Acinetobacter amyesii TaxID=2942470 RepID=A0A1T1GR16_9GAMM|nr:hypothetical protein B1202_15070 [Acinetobacter amyesii]